MIVDLSSAAHALSGIADPAERRGAFRGWVGRLLPPGDAVLAVLPSEDRGAFRQHLVGGWGRWPEGAEAAQRAAAIELAEVVVEAEGAVIEVPAGDVVDGLFAAAHGAAWAALRGRAILFSNRRRAGQLDLEPAEAKFAPAPFGGLADVLRFRGVSGLGAKRTAAIAAAYPSAEDLVGALIRDDLEVSLPAPALEALRAAAPTLVLWERLYAPLGLAARRWG
jgi:hypothetical protein